MASIRNAWVLPNRHYRGSVLVIELPDTPAEAAIGVAHNQPCVDVCLIENTYDSPTLLTTLGLRPRWRRKRPPPEGWTEARKAAVRRSLHFVEKRDV